jgi:putative membrane protein
MKKIHSYLLYILKGLGMGAANVIPGVSGGTIALITGIFERLINAIKSFDLKAIQLLLKGKMSDFVRYTDFWFLVSVLGGIALALVSLARLLDFLFVHYSIHIWAYFFGLILASVYFVGRRIAKWNIAVLLFFILGTAIAVSISIMTPARENDALVYLFVCGALAACSMILPGLSGSFILILMGNYQLLMIDSINQMDFPVLIPFIIGAAFGLLAFSHLLSYIFKKFKDQTIALLSGFILGSLSILWPWKQVLETYIDRHGEIKPVLQKNVLPAQYSEYSGNENHLLFAVILILLGILSIWILEKSVQKKEE